MAKDISQLQKDMDDVFAKVIDKDFLEEVGELMRSIIYKRTKTGKGLDKDSRTIGGSKLADLKDVSDGYAEYRKGRITGPFPPRGNKSNLTFTGELLEAMNFVVKGNDVYVQIEGQHSSGISMRELLDRVSKKRPFFGLSDTEMKILDSFIRRRLRERIRELNKK